MNIEDMIEDLVAYFEAAGFDDFYECELKNKTDDEITDLYKQTFKRIKDKKL